MARNPVKADDRNRWKYCEQKTELYWIEVTKQLKKEREIVLHDRKMRLAVKVRIRFPEKCPTGILRKQPILFRYIVRDVQILRFVGINSAGYKR